eukprot:IDg10498t1
MPHRANLNEAATAPPLEEAHNALYQQSVGELRYLTDSTRIYIAFTVALLAAFTQTQLHRRNKHSQHLPTKTTRHQLTGAHSLETFT